jgi:hypothetical protein
MKHIATLSGSKELLKNLLFGFAAILFIVLAPALAHLANFPIYYIEPMRLMLILALAHTQKANAYALALSLPLVSFLFSGHPEVVKMLIITAELTLNVWLFYFIFKKTSRTFISIFLSIILSKMFCYSLYLVFFSWAFFMSETQTVFLISQLIATTLFSAYLYWAMNHKLSVKK